MSYPDFLHTDRRNYKDLINVVRASQKKKDYEMAAIALAVMIHATPWRQPEADRKVELCLVRPSTLGTRVTFLFLLRDSFLGGTSGNYTWVQFPAHLFKGDIAAGLAYEASENKAAWLPSVSSANLGEFKAAHTQGYIPGDLIHVEGCLDVIRRNKGSATSSIFSNILNEELCKQCHARFTEPYQFAF